MWILWLIVLIATAALEAITIGLTSIWFSLGSLAALIVALCHGALWLQITVFLLVSVVALIFTRPLAVKYLNANRKATNADRVLDMVGVVTQEIDNIQAKGAVTVGGKIWTARSWSGAPIAKGTFVRPISIEGVKLIVAPAEKAEEIKNSTINQ